MSTTLNELFENVKGLRKRPRSWKDATIVPVYKEDGKQSVKNHRPVSLLSIDSKGFLKRLFDPLYLHLAVEDQFNQTFWNSLKTNNSWKIKFLVIG